ncbi:MAG TPA: uroporphyrinogen decarboxylase family protein [Acidobacteriota bacterium]|nr:uroporphyrinogen decarboxylase family protein [Acidobacteriota bacterium]
MNSLERITATLAFRKSDRVPVIAQVFGHAAAVARIPLNEYLQNGDKLAQGQLAALERYGYDAVFGFLDANVETEAVGSTLYYTPSHYPVVEKHIFTAKTDPASFAVPDPLSAGRMPEVLRALRILKNEVGSRTLVVGCVLGPFSLVTQLLGMEQALYLVQDDPARLASFMDFATDTAICFGQAQIDSGAHLPLVFEPAASLSVVPPSFFEKYDFPRLRRIFDAFSCAGAVANWLHIAGPIIPIMPSFPCMGVHIAHFDYCVPPLEAIKQLPTTCLDGNIKSLTFLHSSSAEIEAEAAALLDVFSERGGYILSSGCEIPPESPAENIAALVRAAVRKAS